MQGWYIGITAASQAVKAGSTPVPCSKKKDTPGGCLSFWSSTFAPQKWSPAGGRLNASGGTRQRFPPHTPPSLRCAGVRQQNLWAVTKRNTIRIGWCFLFGMPRAGWNSLPRPARSASNPEVKAGLLRMALPFVGCREAISSLVYFAAQSVKNKEKPSFGRFQSVKKACHCEPVRRLAWQSVPKTHKFCVFRRFLSKKMRIPTSLRAAKQVPLVYSSE